MGKDQYGLTSLAEDMNFLGVQTPRRQGAPEELLRMEESFAGLGGRRSTLSRMNESAPRQSSGQRPQAPRQGQRPSARVAEHLQAFESASRTQRPVPQNFRRGIQTATVQRLMENVSRSLAELRSVDRAEAVRAWAQTAVVSETFAHRFKKIGKRLGERRIIAAGELCGRLANQSAAIVSELRSHRNPANLAAKMTQALGVVAESMRLYGGLTEGPDAPFPVPPPGAPAPKMPPTGGAPEEDPLSIGMGSPTQGMEGDISGGMGGGMGGGMPGGMEAEADPMGLGGFGVDPNAPPKPGAPGVPGAPMEGIEDQENLWFPYQDGRDDPDLIEGDGAPGDDDPDPLAVPETP